MEETAPNILRAKPEDWSLTHCDPPWFIQLLSHWLRTPSLTRDLTRDENTEAQRWASTEKLETTLRGLILEIFTAIVFTSNLIFLIFMYDYMEFKIT